MTAASVMSTDSVEPIERAAIWRDWIWTHFGGLESDLYCWRRWNIDQLCRLNFDQGLRLPLQEVSCG